MSSHFPSGAAANVGICEGADVLDAVYIVSGLTAQYVFGYPTRKTLPSFACGISLVTPRK